MIKVINKLIIWILKEVNLEIPIEIMISLMLIKWNYEIDKILFILFNKYNKIIYLREIRQIIILSEIQHLIDLNDFFIFVTVPLRIKIIISIIEYIFDL
jgi:hypothetical protein